MTWEHIVQLAKGAGFIVKVCLFLVALVVILVVMQRIGDCQRGSQPATPAIGQVPEVKPAISENSPLVIEPKENQGGILHITVKPKKSQLGAPEPMPQELTVLLPRDPRKEPPRIIGDTASANIISEYTPVREPYLVFRPSVIVGGTLNIGGVSPFGGVGLLRFFDRVVLGVGVSREAIGPFLGWELWRQFQLGPLWQLIRFKPGNPQWAVQISYGF